ncbi:ADP-ribosylation factor 3 [Gossypium australe]|uniref:ADP-ribosylation factor 3 n=1 Tax=Gossypium australe TaxID=47621 RepID=A0A5B6WU20_9ROSI|nr:ADP-ribosylation factor 3 [Gossypium australe]
MDITARASGKVILADEHAVVHGYTVVSSSIDLYTVVSLRLYSGISLSFFIYSHDIDTDRIGIAKEEFHAILEEDELKGAIALIFANKQDLPGALDAAAAAADRGFGVAQIKKPSVSNI